MTRTPEQTAADDALDHAMNQPHFDRDNATIDTSGCGIPDEFWEHLTRALLDRTYRL